MLIDAPRFGDARGFFSETVQRRPLRRGRRRSPISCRTITASRSASARLRGLHCQIAPRAQGKLVRVRARRHLRCRRRYPRRLAHLRPACRGRADCGELVASSGSPAASCTGSARSSPIPRCSTRSRLTTTAPASAACAGTTPTSPSALGRCRGRRGAVGQGRDPAATGRMRRTWYGHNHMQAGLILVAGGAGQVARALADGAGGRAVRVVGRPDFDFDRPETIAATLEQARPALVVNAAAYTAVDKAETDADAAWRANRDGPAAIAAWCAGHGVPSSTSPPTMSSTG